MLNDKFDVIFYYSNVTPNIHKQLMLNESRMIFIRETKKHDIGIVIIFH